MKIQTRILVLLAILTGTFILVLFFLSHFERGRLEMIKIQQRQEKEKVFAQIIRMRAASAEGMAKDYTLWDEMVTFVATGDKDWAKSNIDGGLVSFNTDAFWIYNLQSQLVHSLKNFEHPDFVEAPLVPLKAADVFHGQSFTYFFINTDVGVMDIHGSTINYVADEKRERPQGYMLIGRIWNQSFIDDLAAITETRIKIIPAEESLAIQTEHNKDIGEISFVHVLEGVDHQPVARLFVSFHSDMISRADKNSKTISILFVSFSIILFILISLVLIFWISLPLRRISLALSQENVSAIDSLENNQSEMGAIARMIKRFFVQKQKLWSEMQERALAEENLKKAYENLQLIQRQLIQAEKMSSIGQLAAGVAHEINNPVGFISNNIEVLQEYIKNYEKIFLVVENIKIQADNGDLERVKEAVIQIRKLEEDINLAFVRDDVHKLLEHSSKGLERIRKIVLDLRTFAREDHVETKEMMRIEEIIDGILSIVRSELKYKAELIKDYGDTPLIPCHAQRLGQVFINLLVNATHSIEGKGKIMIKTYQQNQYVCVDIADTGKGIAEENLTKIFDPFFTTKPIGQGTGLGLSISYEIIKKHGGEIRVSSTVGEGTTFHIVLPIQAQTRESFLEKKETERG